MDAHESSARTGVDLSPVDHVRAWPCSRSSASGKTRVSRWRPRGCGAAGSATARAVRTSAQVNLHRRQDAAAGSRQAGVAPVARAWSTSRRPRSVAGRSNTRSPSSCTRCLTGPRSAGRGRREITATKRLRAERAWAERRADLRSAAVTVAPQAWLGATTVGTVPACGAGSSRGRRLAHRSAAYLFHGRTARAWPGWGRGVRRVALSAAACGLLVWLSSGVRTAGHRDEVRLKRGLPSSK